MEHVKSCSFYIILLVFVGLYMRMRMRDYEKATCREEVRGRLRLCERACPFLSFFDL